MQHFRAPRWLPGGNLQTIWPALYSRRASGPAPQYRRERWDAPDGDFAEFEEQLHHEVAIPTLFGRVDATIQELLHGGVVSALAIELDRLVRWARRQGAPFDGSPEPTLCSLIQTSLSLAWCLDSQRSKAAASAIGWTSRLRSSRLRASRTKPLNWN